MAFATRGHLSTIVDCFTAEVNNRVKGVACSSHPSRLFYGSSRAASWVLGLTKEEL